MFTLIATIVDTHSTLISGNCCKTTQFDEKREMLYVKLEERKTAKQDLMLEIDFCWR